MICDLDHLPEATQLPLEEQLELARRAQAGDRRAADQLWRAIFRWARRLAMRMLSGRRTSVTLDELVAEFGLVFAEKLPDFETDRRLKFCTFITPWFVSGAQGLLGRVHRGQRTAMNALVRAREQHEPVDPDELAARIGVRPSTIYEAGMALAGRREIALDAPLHRRGNGWPDAPDAELSTVGATLTADVPTPEEAVAEAEERTRLKAALARAKRQLEPRERRVLRERYERDETRSLEQVAPSFGISRQMVLNIERLALGKLREQLVHEVNRSSISSALA